MSDQKAKLITSLLDDEELLENIFKVESLAQPNVWG